jgi:Ca2+-binding RTX toxin-like protein
MKPITLVVNRVNRALILAAGCSWLGSAWCATDPTLKVNLTQDSQTMILRWTGINAVPYQVEAGSSLTDWTNIGPVMSGTGSELSFTNSILGQSQGFLRVTRVFPAAPGSASFNPSTGLLTVVGDALHTVINVANDGTGVIAVNGGAIPVVGGVATVSNTVLIQVLGSPGDDQITISSGLPPAHLFGAEGNDTLFGGSGSDLIVGGPGSDIISGRQGSDLIYLDGGDTFIWNPGDGSDLVQGEGSNNTVVFNGGNISENITLSANGSRLRLTRNVANITLDVDGVQTVNINPVGGADNIVVNPLAPTTVTLVNINLAGVVGTTNGDSQVDTVTVNGTGGPDTINVAANAGAIEVSGLGPLVRVTNAELTNDLVVVNGFSGATVNVNGTADADTMQVFPSPVAGYVRVSASGFPAPIDVIGAAKLSINGLGGPDTITASGNLAALGIPLVYDGGDGDDTILGGNANETIIGGNGNDIVRGGQGTDLILLGDGDDTFTWNPGDGSDTIEGQGGNNTLIFNGANISENIALLANGSRLRLTRNVANIVLDVNGIQTVNIQALGGADNISIDRLDGTDVAQVNVDLGGPGGTGDLQPDTVTINGAASPDTIKLTANAGAVVVSGLAAQVQILHPELAFDTLIINGLGATGSVSIGPGVTGLIGLVINQ